MTTTPAPRSSRIDIVALITALILGPVGFMLCCLLTFGSAHGDADKSRQSILFFGVIAAGPPLALGLLARRTPGARRWMGVVAVVIGAALAALYTLGYLSVHRSHYSERGGERRAAASRRADV